MICGSGLPVATHLRVAGLPARTETCSDESFALGGATKIYKIKSNTCVKKTAIYEVYQWPNYCPTQMIAGRNQWAHATNR